MTQDAASKSGPVGYSRPFRWFPEALNPLLLLLGMFAVCSKLAEDGRLTLATEEFIERAVTIGGAGVRRSAVQRHALLVAGLEEEHRLTPDSLLQEVARTARKRSGDTSLPFLERAKAAYVLTFPGATHHEPIAGRLARSAAEQERRADRPDNHRLIQAFEIAAWDDAFFAFSSPAPRSLLDALSLADKAAAPLEWARIQHALAQAHYETRDLAGAESMLREVVAIRSEKLGPLHPDTLASRLILTTASAEAHRTRWNAALHEPLLRDLRLAFGSAHPDTLEMRLRRGDDLFSQGRFAEAEAEYRTMLPLLSVRPEPPYIGARSIWRSLRDAVHRQGRKSEALALCREWLASAERTCGHEHRNAMFARYLLAGELQGNQRYAEAAAELRQLIAIQERALGPHHQNVANTRMNLGVVYSAMKMHAEAEAEYRLSLAFYQHRANPSAYDREEAARLSRHLASSLQNQGRYKEAEVLKEQANALAPIHVGVPAKRMPLPPIPAPSRLVK